jgi:hypothetical protein
MQTGTLSVNISNMALGVDYLIIAYFSSVYQIQLNILFLTLSMEKTITFVIKDPSRFMDLEGNHLGNQFKNANFSFKIS